MRAANWFGLRCLLHRCPFRPDSLGAYCTLGSCNRRITIHHSQIGYWQTLSSYNPGPGDLAMPHAAAHDRRTGGDAADQAG